MKVKFNKFERVAGAFVALTILGVFISFVGVAFQKGWFDSKVPLKTSFDTADGLTPGTHVHMNGLRVGSVEDVVLSKDNRVEVHFSILEKVFNKVRRDSVVRTFRPFIIGDRVLEISVGSSSSPNLSPGDILTSEQSMDVMDLIGGRQLGPYMDSMKESMASLATLLEAFRDPKRVNAIVEVFDELAPTVKEVKAMARQVKIIGYQANGKRRLSHVLSNLVVSTDHLNKVLPEVVTVVNETPDLGGNLSQVVSNLATLTEEMKKLIPAIAAVAPELPQASRRAIDAMNEAVITLKAMQKSFLLRGAVDEIREEEEEKIRLAEEERRRKLEEERSIASEPEDDGTLKSEESPSE